MCDTRIPARRGACSVVRRSRNGRSDQSQDCRSDRGFAGAQNFPLFYFATRTSPGPGIETLGGLATYQSPPTRATTIRNNYYILFYIQYINVDFCVQIRFYRHGDFTKVDCSLIPTSHPARMSCLSNREPSTLASRSPLCFSSPRSCPPPCCVPFQAFSRSSSHSSKSRGINTLLQLIIFAALCTVNLQTIAFIGTC